MSDMDQMTPSTILRRLIPYPRGTAIVATWNLRAKRFGRKILGLNQRGERPDQTADGPRRDHEWLADQAGSYLDNFLVTRELKDLEAAIKHLEEAVSLMPQGHSDIPLCF
ncbi:hypothetical protein BDV93DRAFT_525587, partial [Ceratobasidium sp. AG-I]